LPESAGPTRKGRPLKRTYNPTSVAALAKTAPFPWHELLIGAGLGGLDHVVVAENTAITKIAAVYARTSVGTLKAWQAFRATDSAAPYLSKRFATASFAFHEKVMSGVAEQPPRWRRAVNTVDAFMGEAIGRVYVARHFPPEAKAQIANLVTQLRIAFKGRIERLDWISERTKLKALDKLARLNVKIAYPDKWRDYSALKARPNDLIADVQAGLKFDWMRRVTRLNLPVDRDEWDMTPQTVDAYYDTNLNELVLPAARTAAAVLRPRGGSGGQLRRHWRDNWPRDDSWIRQWGAQV
jgi:putative endopeptidase